METSARSDPDPTSPAAFYIGSWLVQPSLNLLTGRERPVSLEPKVMQVLVCLATRPGEAVTRDALHAAVWPDTIVGDKALTGAISKLRKVFGDDPQQPQVIETISKRGYRLLAPVVPATEGPPAYGGDAAPSASMTWTVDPPRAVQQKRGSFQTLFLLAIGLLILLVGAGVAWIFLADTPALTPGSPARPLATSASHEVSPVLSPDGDVVAFAWGGVDASNWDIYVKQPDTETPLRLTDDPAHDLRPVWSPDGTRIAFTRYTAEGCTLYVVPALSGPERRLAPCPGAIPPDGWVFFSASLAWSPDGQWLALPYQASGEGPHSVHLLSLETLEWRKVTTPPPTIIGDFDPAFSPDGTELAFSRLLGGGASDLYVVSLRDSVERRLTFDRRSILGLDWTASGRYIIFSSERDGTYNLWRIRPRGGTPRWVPAAGWNLKEPSVARRGKRMVYETWRYDDNIWRVPVRADTVASPPTSTRFIASTLRDMHPHYAPDGSRVAFVSNRSGSYEIWTADPDGASPVQVTDMGGPVVGMPRWSPDGQRLVFEARPNGQADLYVVAAQGGRPRRLTGNMAEDVAPSWAPNGTEVYFASKRTGTWQVWKISVADAVATQVTQAGGYVPALSQDGQTVYFTQHGVDGLWRQPAEGGEARIVLEALGAGDWGNWAVHDEGIYYLTRQPSPALSFYSFASATVQVVTPLAQLPGPNRPGMTLSPDGQWLLFTQLDQTESDLMILDDFR